MNFQLIGNNMVILTYIGWFILSFLLALILYVEVWPKLRYRLVLFKVWFVTITASLKSETKEGKAMFKNIAKLSWKLLFKKKE